MKTLWQSRTQADIAAERLRKLAQPQRLMILSLLLEGEKSVTEIDAATGIGQPALSQQLAELRKAEFVTTRRQAKQIYYSLTDDSLIMCVRNIEALFGVGHPTPTLPGTASPAAQAEPPTAVKGAAKFVRIG